MPRLHNNLKYFLYNYLICICSVFWYVCTLHAASRLGIIARCALYVGALPGPLLLVGVSEYYFGPSALGTGFFGGAEPGLLQERRGDGTPIKIVGAAHKTLSR